MSRTKLVAPFGLRGWFACYCALLWMLPAFSPRCYASRAIAGIDTAFSLSDTFPEPPNVFATAQVGEILAGYGHSQFFEFDRSAAMVTADTLGVHADIQKIDIPFPANSESPVPYIAALTQASRDWEVMIEPNPNLGDTTFMQLRVRVDGNAALSPSTAAYMNATWRYHVQLNEQLQPVSLSNPFNTPLAALLTDMIEVPVGEPFTLRQSLTGQVDVDERVIPSVVFPLPEMYDAFGSVSLTASTQSVGLFNRIVDDGVVFVPVEANFTVNGGAPPLQLLPRTLAGQLEELTRRSIRGEIEPTFAGSGIITLRGDEELEALAANLPFRVVSEVENKMADLRLEEISAPLVNGQIDTDEYRARQNRANEISALFRDIKNEPTFAEFRREATPSATEILVYSLLYLFFGSDPFYGLYTPDQPLTLPLPDPSTFTFSTGPTAAGVTLELPHLWGGGRVSPEVLNSQVTVNFVGGNLELVDLTTEIASYEILGGQQTGLNRGFFPDGGQVWSQFDPNTGELEAYGEGLITNDLYPAERPIFVFQDIAGRVLQIGNELVVEAIAENEPMIVPGLPGDAPAPQPIAYAATRATFDANSGELRLLENTDNSQLADISVVLTPTGVFGHGVDNTAEPLIGAHIIIDPLTLSAPVTPGQETHFSDAPFEIRNDQGTFARGTFTNVRIEEDVMALMADVEFETVLNVLASPFIVDWQSDPGPVVLLARIGILDLLAATADLTASGMSPTDFMSFTRAVRGFVIPEPSAVGLIAVGGLGVARMRRRQSSPGSTCLGR